MDVARALNRVVGSDREVIAPLRIVYDLEVNL